VPTRATTAPSAASASAPNAEGPRLVASRVPATRRCRCALVSQASRRDSMLAFGLCRSVWQCRIDDGDGNPDAPFSLAWHTDANSRTLAVSAGRWFTITGLLAAPAPSRRRDLGCTTPAAAHCDAPAARWCSGGAGVAVEQALRSRITHEGWTVRAESRFSCCGVVGGGVGRVGSGRVSYPVGLTPGRSSCRSDRAGELSTWASSGHPSLVFGTASTSE